MLWRCRFHLERCRESTAVVQIVRHLFDKPKAIDADLDAGYGSVEIDVDIGTAERQAHVERSRRALQPRLFCSRRAPGGRFICKGLAQAFRAVLLAHRDRLALRCLAIVPAGRHARLSIAFLALPAMAVARAASDGQGGQCRAAGGGAGALAREDQLAVLDGGDGVVFAPQAAQERDIALPTLTDGRQRDRRQIGRYARYEAIAPRNLRQHRAQSGVLPGLFPTVADVAGEVGGARADADLIGRATPSTATLDRRSTSPAAASGSEKRAMAATMTRSGKARAGRHMERLPLHMPALLFQKPPGTKRPFCVVQAKVSNLHIRHRPQGAAFHSSPRSERASRRPVVKV